MRISDWFRRSAVRSKVSARLSIEDLKNLRTLSGMANNLNQLTRLAHSQGLFTVERKCRELLVSIDRILTMMNKDDR